MARQNQLHKMRAEQLQLRKTVQDLTERLAAVEKNAKVQLF